MEQKNLVGYGEHLRRRGLAPRTVGNHLLWVSRFLDYRTVSGKEKDKVELAEVDEFLALWLPTLARRSRPIPLATMRGFLKFLFEEGVLARDLSRLLIGVRIYRDEFLPKGLKRAEIIQVLGEVDRRAEHGLRDYAIMILLATYGLRVSEILSLKLSDFDWGHNAIRFYRPKTRDHLDLPLLAEAGNAVIDYIRKERPRAAVPELFVFPQKQKTAKVASIARKYFKRAGIEVSGNVTKTFRHSLAMEMVSRGVPFKVISDALGHRNGDSTYVYAKTDVAKLREAALCPPGGEPCPSK